MNAGPAAAAALGAGEPGHRALINEVSFELGERVTVKKNLPLPGGV
jgi:hypothetical protein